MLGSLPTLYSAKSNIWQRHWVLLDIRQGMKAVKKVNASVPYRIDRLYQFSTMPLS